MATTRPATHEGTMGKTFTPLRATFRIGSIHGRLSYAHDEKAFHKSEVPAKAKEAKRHIRMLKRGNRLGLKQSTWNNSTYTEERLCVRNQNQLSAHDHPMYKHNYRAEKLPPKNRPFVPKASHLQFDRSLLITDPKDRSLCHTMPVGKRSEEMPVHPNLIGKKKWDTGTSFSYTQKVRKTERDDAKMRDYRRHHSVKLVGYLNPMEREKRSQRQMRELKTMIREKPGLAAAAGKMVGGPLGDLAVQASKTAGGGRLKRGGASAKGPFRPYKTTVSRKFKKYEHSGVYEFRDGRWMWSDTASEVKNSRGDIVTIVNPDAWNFAAPGHD